MKKWTAGVRTKILEEEETTDRTVDRVDVPDRDVGDEGEPERAEPATPDRIREDGGRSRVVVVTGASAGVGRATVREFARAGCRIGLVARGRERLEETRLEVEGLGGSAVVLPADVADAEQVETAAERAEAKLGPIDVWVNNAMTTVFSRFLAIEPEEYRRVTEVTYLGTVHGTLAALRRMLPRDRGTIVQVGSALAYRSIPLQSAYCGAKSAIRGFTDSIRSELIHDDSDVHLCMVQLPALNTPQFEWCRVHMDRHPRPVPPIYEPEVAGRAVAWAADRREREVVVGHSARLTMLGQKVAPGLLDRYLADNGWDAQLTDEPADPDRTDNLFDPAPGSPGAAGSFGDRSRARSVDSWLNRHQSWIAAGIGIVAAGVGAAAAPRS